MRKQLKCSLLPLYVADPELSWSGLTLRRLTAAKRDLFVVRC